MEERVDLSLAGKPQADTDAGPGERLAEEHASRILERAAALDAKLNSEVEVGELREAAAAAGILPEAFDQAMREQSNSASDGGAHAAGQGAGMSEALGTVRAPGSVEVASYAALLRDLLGEDCQVVVVEDRIECTDRGGVTVSISPSPGDTAVAVTSAGKLSRLLLGLGLTIVIPGISAVMIGLDRDIGEAYV